jgi:hypothetical protein
MLTKLKIFSIIKKFKTAKKLLGITKSVIKEQPN